MENGGDGMGGWMVKRRNQLRKFDKRFFVLFLCCVVLVVWCSWRFVLSSVDGFGDDFVLFVCLCLVSCEVLWRCCGDRSLRFQ